MHDFGLDLPAELTTAYFADPTAHGAPPGAVHGLFNVPAAAIILILTALLARGTRESSLFNNIIVSIKVMVVLAVIFFGAGYVNLANWTPFVPETTCDRHFGWFGVLRGASVVFFAYIGFDAVSTAAQEAKLPQRDMPIGILGSLVICTILYIAVAAVATGIVPYKELGVPDPIAVAMDRTGIVWLSWPVKFGALAGLTTAMLVLLSARPACSTPWLRTACCRRCSRGCTKHGARRPNSQILVGVIVALTAGLLPLENPPRHGQHRHAGRVRTGLRAVLYLRRNSPDLHRPFRAPGIPVLPILGILSCLVLMLALPIETWIRLLVWMGLGLVVYFLYGVNHAKR